MTEPGRSVWTVAGVIAPIQRAYPPGTAESWDRVGLAVGDPDAGVEAVLLTVDVTAAVVAEALDRKVQLIISHHPLLLRGLHAVRTDEPKGRLITELIRHGIALYTAHTNADIAVDGTAAALADALGLIDPRPLVAVPVRQLDKIVVFVPDSHAEPVLAALSAAGAGAIDAYDRVAFRTSGVGTFRPLPGAHPHLGRIGEIEQVAETRLEMIMDHGLRDVVVAALLATHPYETPAFDVFPIADLGPGSAATGLGRVGDVEPCTLAEFATLVAERVPGPPGAVRVAGDPERSVRRVALQAGAGDDLFEQARASGADVYLTSDLRHHPATEALAWPDAPALIDIPHAAAESLWLPRLTQLLRAGGIDPAAVRIWVSEVRTDPWR